MMKNVKQLTTLTQRLQLLLVLLVGMVRNFFSGRFGRYVLKSNYRKAWLLIWGIIIFLAVWRWIVCPFFAWWDSVVRFLNYVIWG